MHNRAKYTFITLVSFIALGIFWSSAYQTITWWDNSSYPIVANCLGVESPPGSLLLTILGWIVLKLTFFDPKVFALNLFAGLLAVGTIVQLFYLVLLLFKKTIPNNENKTLTLVGISLGLLTFAFSETFWTYAIQFTPYMLTTCMTAIIIYQMLRFWYEKDKSKIIFLVLIISFLIGLDFSIHRTNSLLVPGFALMILLKDFKLFFKLKFYFLGLTGLIVGLAVHLLKIPLAIANPIINFNNPDNLSRFYDYVSLKQYGGGFLTDVLTRKAPIFSVQTMDYINAFSNNFTSLDSPFAIVSVCTALIALGGFYSLFRASKKTALMLVMLFLVTTAMTIFYFDVPENFFRSFSRHYLPSFVIFSLFIAYGAGAFFAFFKNNLKLAIAWKVLFIIILFLMPLNQILRNYKILDGSNDSFASDYAHNILESSRPNAIIFVMGDVFFPLFYMQQVEGKRTDVDIISISLCNTKWYVEQLMSDHYNLPQIFTDEEIANLNALAWADSTIDIPFEGNLSDYKLESIDSLNFVPILVKPTINDKYIMAQDWFVIKLLQENKWKRPVYFTQPLRWLQENARPEGLIWQIVPQSPADINADILQTNIVDNYIYNGYANSDRPLEFPSKRIGEGLWTQFIQLASKQQSSGDSTAARTTIEFAKKHLPLDRVIRSDETMERFKSYIKILEQ